jgi:hypothetical protein
MKKIYKKRERMVIIVNIIGGVGNQLFQYAFARSLTDKRGCLSKLDISGFSRYYKLHNYSLNHFNIQGVFSSPQEANRFRPINRSLLKIYSIFQSFRPKLRQKYFKERNWFVFDSDVFRVNTPVYFDGYWQNEKYFKEIERDIREELTFKTPPNEENILAMRKIKQVNAVSIHFRRGDYVASFFSRKIQAVCNLEYYRKAVELIGSKIQNPHFFAFSDDPNWVKENFKTNFPVTYLTHNNAEKNYEDLRLMSLCNHHIIPNSSFSWWGAWLNPNPEKIVIAPMSWSNLPGVDSSNATPLSWLRL